MTATKIKNLRKAEDSIGIAIKNKPIIKRALLFLRRFLAVYKRKQPMTRGIKSRQLKRISIPIPMAEISINQPIRLVLLIFFILSSSFLQKTIMKVERKAT